MFPYIWDIYFAGPMTRWSGKPVQKEIIARGMAPWRWLARMQMLSTFRGLDPSKCGYVLAHDVDPSDGIVQVLEVYDPGLDPMDQVAVG